MPYCFYILVFKLFKYFVMFKPFNCRRYRKQYSEHSRQCCRGTPYTDKVPLMFSYIIQCCGGGEQKHTFVHQDTEKQCMRAKSGCRHALAHVGGYQAAHCLLPRGEGLPAAGVPQPRDVFELRGPIRLQAIPLSMTLRGLFVHIPAASAA